MQYSIPEGEVEMEEKGIIQRTWNNIFGKANQHVPLQKIVDGGKKVIDYLTSNGPTPRESINDPIYKEGKLWGQMVTGMDKIDELLKEYRLTADDLSPVKVYVLDTGCDATHEDLSVTSDKKDGHGHGTHVAGTIAARTNNAIGVSSIGAEGIFEMHCIKVLSDGGTGSLSGIAQAIRKAADEGADVINMSLGGRGTSTLMDKAIKYADAKGTIVVVAAGNDNTDAKNFTPANIHEAIAVAAVGYDEDEENQFKAPFSNYGETVDVCAPGMEILSTIPLKSNIGKQRPDKIYKPGYAELQGTSMASPHAASLVAMLKAVNPELDREGIVRILQETGTEPVTDKGKPIGKCIDAYAAVKKALDLAVEWEL
ncbi:MAG: S8 family serine peptidase [Nanoarchaeota archaeon]|nr:S8 family serine peptidase [Nanoarchaeota archaeon]